MNCLKLAMLVTWREEGLWSLIKSLTERGNRVHVFQPLFSDPGISAPVRKFFKRTCELYLPMAALLTRKRFDVVLSWSMRMAVVYGILSRLSRGSSLPVHVMRDLHFNMERRDLMYRLRMAIFRMALPGIDFFLCTSREEERIYCEMFGISPDRIAFFPDAPPDRFLSENVPCDKGQYIFSYGNSDRDFNTLIEAVRGSNIRCVILSQTFKPGNSLPENVILLSSHIPEEDIVRLIISSSLVVLPLKHYRVAAGQNTMLEALALGHPLVVSENFATCEYAQHGVSAFFFRPGDVRDLKSKIQSVLESPDSARQAGERGRNAVSELPGRQVSFLLDLLYRIL